MKQYLNSLWIQIVIFVSHFEPNVVALGLFSRGRGEYGSDYASKQQKRVSHSFSKYQSAVCLYWNVIPWDVNNVLFYWGNYYRKFCSERQLAKSVSRHINKDGLILTPWRCQVDGEREEASFSLRYLQQKIGFTHADFKGQVHVCAFAVC